MLIRNAGKPINSRPRQMNMTEQIMTTKPTVHRSPALRFEVLIRPSPSMPNMVGLNLNHLKSHFLVRLFSCTEKV